MQGPQHGPTTPNREQQAKMPAGVCPPLLPRKVRDQGQLPLQPLSRISSSHGWPMPQLRRPRLSARDPSFCLSQAHKQQLSRDKARQGPCGPRLLAAHRSFTTHTPQIHPTIASSPHPHHRTTKQNKLQFQTDLTPRALSCADHTDSDRRGLPIHHA